MINEAKRAARRLTNNSDFQLLLEHIRRERDQAQAAGMKASDPVLIYRAQGRFEALEALDRLTDPPKHTPRKGSANPF